MRVIVLDSHSLTGSRPTAAVDDAAPPWRWVLPPPRRALLLLASLVACGATVPLEACLSPGEERRHNFVAPEVPAAHCIRGLTPRTTYEVVVSYPGAHAAGVRVDLLVADPPAAHLPGRHDRGDSGSGGGGGNDGSEGGGGGGSVMDGPERAAPGRRLLDTEKLVFATDAQGAVLHPGLPGPTPAERVFVRIRSGRGGDGGDGGSGGTAYNVRLDALVGGVVPTAALPVAATLAGAVLLTAAGVTALLAWRWSPFRAGGTPVAAAESGAKVA